VTLFLYYVPLYKMDEGRSAPVMSSSLATEHDRSALIKVVATTIPNSTMMHNNGVVAATATDPGSNPHNDRHHNHCGGVVAAAAADCRSNCHMTIVAG
jgi:hypothetical protein